MSSSDIINKQTQKERLKTSPVCEDFSGSYHITNFVLKDSDQHLLPRPDKERKINICFCVMH